MLAETLPATGSFDCAAVASGRRFDASEFIATDAPLAGLQQEAGYIWGTVRDEDATMYSVMRRIAPTPPSANSEMQTSLGGKLIVLSAAPGSDGMEMRREPRGAVDSSEVAGTLIGENTACFASAPTAAGRPMRLVLGEDDFSYREDGVIDVTGRLAAPPLQWYLPGPTASLLYTTQTWLVDGELTGKHVRGFLFWEQAWMLPGGRLYVEKDPLHDAEYLTWYSWANHWTDGSCEVGHFLFGKKDFHVGVTARSDGTVTAARQMDARITRAADGYWHDGISYDLDRVPWVCEVSPHGRMTGLGPMPNPQQEGRIRRLDDDRQPDVWMAWGETVPAAGNSRHVCGPGRVDLE
jgi:hypothetical protein